MSSQTEKRWTIETFKPKPQPPKPKPSKPNKAVKAVKPKKMADPARTMRAAGQTRTILLYPLHNSIQEPEIEEFVKRASLSSPLRIELFKFHSLRKDQSNENMDETSNYNTYAYCTFSSNTDCWLIRKHLNHKLLHNRKVSICFSNVPRSDLEGLTRMIEFGTNYPPITNKNEIIKFLNSYNKTISESKNANISDSDLSLISNPTYIDPAPGHGGLKGKWFLTYPSPEIATKALEFLSGKWYYDTQNNANRFVILNYQLRRKAYATDRKACFYGLTDRVRLRNLTRDMTDSDDILLFLQSHGFEINKDIIDVYIIHQMTHILQKKYNRDKAQHNQKKFTPRNGYAIVTFKNSKLANKAYTDLNNKHISDACQIQTAFDSPKMTDPLKLILKGKTTVVHLSNLPWNVSKAQLREWLFDAGKKFVESNKHLAVAKEEVSNESKEETNPYMTDVEAGKYCTHPCEIYIKYRDGYTTGRANATFATAEEATVVVEMMNGMALDGREIGVNWALPIRDFRFNRKRNIALHMGSEQSMTNWNKTMERELNDGMAEESVAFKKIQKWEWNRKEKLLKQKGQKKSIQRVSENEIVKVVNEDEKRGKKRKQSFGKPSTKKIKLTL